MVTARKTEIQRGSELHQINRQTGAISMTPEITARVMKKSMILWPVISFSDREIHGFEMFQHCG